MADAENNNPVVRTIPIGDLAPDDNNANRGTARGRKMLKGSLKKLGAGRSILVDKNFTTIAGNKTLDEAKKQGFKRVVVVDSAGDTLVAVRRTDLDVQDKKGQELAIADNRVSEVDLSWDTDVLKQTGAELTEMFEPLELDRMLNEGKNSRQPNTIDLQPPPKMVWVLLGIPFNRFDLVQENLAALEAESEISVQSARNE
jgi:hypothetical protein